MRRQLRFKSTANEQYITIQRDPAQEGLLKQIRKTLGYLETNLRATSLQTHKYESLTKRYGREVFEAYVQQNTPTAYRVFWHYGPDEIGEKGERIYIIAIISHPML